MWLLAWILARRSDNRVAPRRDTRKAKSDGGKKPPAWQQKLNEGTARTTFVIGAVLTLPGATYLAALDKLSKLNYATAVTVVVVIVVNLIQLLLIEIPIVAFKVAPTQTPVLVANAKEWGRLHGRKYGARALVVLGALFTIKGLAEAL